MKILILATNYTVPDKYVASHFIHSRNTVYQNNNFEVSVISFGADHDYVIDGINVYTINTYEKKLKNKKYDLLLSHAPNLRNHYRFIRKYNSKFEHIIYYFHGHEVLISSEIYPKPFKYYDNSSILIRLIIDIYDRLKLIIWRNYLNKNYEKSYFIFVSDWMKSKFKKYVGINNNILKNRSKIIYNCIGEDFETLEYDNKIIKEYDFITIRNILDKSKYGIDIVCKIAQNNPKYKFCIIGKGNYFKFNDMPGNINWIDKNLDHKEIITFLNKSKYALLPTRADSQGVMACEIATFGMPLITSDIEVCKEVFEGFDNVSFINNEECNINIEEVISRFDSSKIYEKNERFFVGSTVKKELEIFRKLMS